MTKESTLGTNLTRETDRYGRQDQIDTDTGRLAHRKETETDTERDTDTDRETQRQRLTETGTGTNTERGGREGGRGEREDKITLLSGLR